jgi:hypothetical protein
LQQNDRWIYFVHGLAAPTDLWRIPSTGGKPERLTQHSSAIGIASFRNDVDYPDSYRYLHLN